MKRLSRVALTIEAAVLAVIASQCLADESINSKLRYGNEKEFQTAIRDAHLLGQLSVKGQAPILIFSGRSNLPCARTDCDSETNVYEEWASNGPSMWNSPSLRYPGSYYDRASGKLIAEVRMFIGRCIDSREGVAWFIRNTDSGHAQVDSVLRSQVSFEYVDVDAIPGPYNGGTLLEDLSGHVEISVARSAVEKHVCREIAPKSKIFTDASEYIVRTPHFRTDCNSPAPLPNEVPLGPGRPGTQIAYLDEETNTSLRVASDGRKITAMNPGGKVLWVRDPFADNNLCAYRSERPIISYMGPLNWSGGQAEAQRIAKRFGHFIEIRFDSSQFGVVDIKTGDFFFAGQN